MGTFKSGTTPLTVQNYTSHSTTSLFYQVIVACVDQVLCLISGMENL